MTPGIVDTGQHSEQESQQDNDDKDHNHHPRVATETDFLLLIVLSNFFPTGYWQALLLPFFSVRVIHLYWGNVIGLRQKDFN